MSDRQARIDSAIDACTECNQRGFSKRSDCDGCTAAVDEELERERDQYDAYLDRRMGWD